MNYITKFAFLDLGPNLQNILRFIIRIRKVYRKVDLTIETYEVLRFLAGIW